VDPPEPQPEDVRDDPVDEAAAGDQHAHGFGGSPECTLCPVCVLLQAVGTTRPDVTSHLMGAARELALALKAAVEGQVEALDRAQAATAQRLQRIRID
jgi:hypothetical protein